MNRYIDLRLDTTSGLRYTVSLAHQNVSYAPTMFSSHALPVLTLPIFLQPSYLISTCLWREFMLDPTCSYPNPTNEYNTLFLTAPVPSGL